MLINHHSYLLTTKLFRETLRTWGPLYVLSERQMALQCTGRLNSCARATVAPRRRQCAAAAAAGTGKFGSSRWTLEFYVSHRLATYLTKLMLKNTMAMSFEIILWSYLPVCHFFSFYQVYYWEKTKKSIFSSHQTLATSLMFCY